MSAGDEPMADFPGDRQRRRIATSMEYSIWINNESTINPIWKEIYKHILIIFNWRKYSSLTLSKIWFHENDRVWFLFGMLQSYLLDGRTDQKTKNSIQSSEWQGLFSVVPMTKFSHKVHIELIVSRLCYWYLYNVNTSWDVMLLTMCYSIYMYSFVAWWRQSAQQNLAIGFDDDLQ